jgi:two-component system sensor histidine kinase AgrC
MDIVMMLGVMGFFVFITLCIESMAIFDVKSKKREFLIAFPLGVAYGFLVRFIPDWIFWYFTLTVFMFIYSFVYRSIRRGLLGTLYLLPIMLTLATLPVMQLNLLGIDVDDLFRDWRVLYIAINPAVLFGVAFLIRHFMKKRVGLHIFNHKIVHFLVVNAGVGLVYMYIHSGADDVVFNIFPQGVHLADFAFVMFFASSAVTLVLILRYISRENAVKAETRMLEASRKYIAGLEDSYRSLRTLKHDYVNMLASFKLYIDTGDMAGLKGYYYEEFTQIRKYIHDQDRLFNDLQSIQVSEVKSILAYKCAEAAGQGIAVHIEAPESIDGFGVSTAVVCQMLGILLDNAIEGTAEADEKTLRVALFRNPNSKTFVIQNTWMKRDIPLNRIFALGYSTKGEGRGIGLHTLRQYTDKIKDLTLSTETSDGHFTQILTVGEA